MPKKLVAYLFLCFALFLTGCGQTASEIDDKPVDRAEVEVGAEKDNVGSDSETATDDDVDTTAQDKKENTTTPNEQKQLTKMKAHYIDVGQADATLLEFGDEEGSYTMLIDTGDWNRTDVVSYLRSQNIQDIDIIAITHPHADHIGQLDKIIDAFNVTEVWMNGDSANSQVFNRALAAIENKGVDYYEPEVGEVFDIGPLEVAVLHPNSLLGDTNNNSIALRMQYGGIAFLFTGDAEQQAESTIVKSGRNLQAQILSVGHHGSNTSSSEGFLKAVKPEVAIYSAGAGNSYGHPHVETVNRLEASGADLYGTDVHGTVIVETDGKTYTVMTNKQGTIKREAAKPTENKTASSGSTDNKTGGGSSGNSGSGQSTPAPPPAKTTTTPPATPPTSGKACVNINTASEAEVQDIIHIGPERAKDLIALRPFSSVDDLDRIKGIGPARIKDIKAQGVACTGG